MDIELLKSYLADILAKRNEIINSDLPSDQKSEALRVYDTENDELNQSLDIFYRMNEYSVSLDIDNISQLLLDLESGTIDVLSKFTPSLYSAVMSKFSSNTGLSANMLTVRQTLATFDLDELKNFYSSLAFGSTFTLSVSADFTLDLNLDHNKNIYFYCNDNNITLGVYPYNGKSRAFSLGSSHYGHNHKTFYKANIIASMVTDNYSISIGHFACVHSPFTLSFVSSTINIGNVDLITNYKGYQSFMYINLNNVTIARQDLSTGYFIRTNGVENITLCIRNVTLSNGLTWQDLIDDVTKVKIING